MVLAEMKEIIEHTLLKAAATRADLERLCREAAEHGLGFVCVSPWFVAPAVDLLAGTGVRVVSVVGFPLGTGKTAAKALEAREAVADGAVEVDMVINVGALRTGMVAETRRDIEQVVAAAGDAGVKVIIETCYLTREEKVLACRIAEEGGARFVKTSTGFGSAGATVEDVRLLRAVVGDRLGVKAAGGIRRLEQALAMVDAGATRVGTSAGALIAREIAARAKEEGR